MLHNNNVLSVDCGQLVANEAIFGSLKVNIKA